MYHVLKRRGGGRKDDLAFQPHFSLDLTLNIISGIDGLLLVVNPSKTLPQRQESGSYGTTMNDLGVHNTASVANRAQCSTSVAHEHAPLLGVAHHI